MNPHHTLTPTYTAYRYGDPIGRGRCWYAGIVKADAPPLAEPTPEPEPRCPCGGQLSRFGACLDAQEAAARMVARRQA